VSRDRGHTSGPAKPVPRCSLEHVGNPETVERPIEGFEGRDRQLSRPPAFRNDHEPMLETRDLTIRFGGHVAVNGVTCSFEPGTLTAIVGPNGAGKTTYFNLISGQLKASAGTVSLGGATCRTPVAFAAHARRPGPRLPAHQPVPAPHGAGERAAGGAGHARGRASARPEPVEHLERPQGADAAGRRILAEVALKDKEHELVANLPHGDQRKLEVALLMALEPQVFMFDEPTAGMNAPRRR
jgi:branched-chain amino acid transport system ATP-binding protein